MTPNIRLLRERLDAAIMDMVNADADGMMIEHLNHAVLQRSHELGVARRDRQIEAAKKLKRLERRRQRQRAGTSFRWRGQVREW